MTTPSPALADALGLLSDDLYVHLEEAESLATQTAEWSADDGERARQLIDDLVVVLRGLLVEHERRDASSACRTCGVAWPCPVVTTIHAVVKDPQRQFFALLQRARENS
ncbi:MAG: hypothetical protein WCF33_06260 [Pseudonocardiaceae bacterium]